MASYSRTYSRRKHQLFVARTTALFMVSAFLAFLLFASLTEAWLVRVVFLGSDFTLTGFVLAVGAVGLSLGVYALALSRLILHFTYRAESDRIAKIVVLGLFFVAYGVLLAVLRDLQSVIPLLIAKLFAILLYFRFWQSQLHLSRVRHGENRRPREFLLSMRSFLVCRWIFLANWLLLCLGFALSLVSADPIVNMAGWESVLMLGGFYLLFQVFVRNPHAHPPLKNSQQRR